MIAILSLNMTARLYDAGQVASTLTITGATTTTPIHVTCANHGIPAARTTIHGVVSGVVGTTEANGLWAMTVVDANTLALFTYDPQGNVVQSIGTHAYVSGGTISFAFPDFGILLGRQNVALSTASATPRIVFVPTMGKAWGYSADGSTGGAPLQSRGNAEQQAMTTQHELATQYSTFEVYVTGAANPPSPNFGDIDATQAIVWTLYGIMFDFLSPGRALVLREEWPSQAASSASMLMRGQQWRGVVQIEQGVRPTPLSFVPHGTSLTMTVVPAGGGSGDDTTFTIT